jgi:hypothetical protein
MARTRRCCRAEPTALDGFAAIGTAVGHRVQARVDDDSKGVTTLFDPASAASFWARSTHRPEVLAPLAAPNDQLC